MISYKRVADEEDYRNAGELFTAYASSLNIDLSFQHFEEELNNLSTMYAPSVGGILLAKNGEAAIGCIAIRKINDTTGELKRMYVSPGYRHQGIGKVLLEEALLLARNCNYKVIKLDTLNHMLPAIKLYKEAGFYEIPPYYHNPIATAVYFEKEL